MKKVVLSLLISITLSACSSFDSNKYDNEFKELQNIIHNNHWHKVELNKASKRLSTLEYGKTYSEIVKKSKSKKANLVSISLFTTKQISRENPEFWARLIINTKDQLERKEVIFKTRYDCKNPLNDKVGITYIWDNIPNQESIIKTLNNYPYRGGEANIEIHFRNGKPHYVKKYVKPQKFITDKVRDHICLGKD
ncbi:TPA: hypothetical protein QB352_001993 [Pasteurella multocida]|nr:hypothetical protein [Pasteurella multocida]